MNSMFCMLVVSKSEQASVYLENRAAVKMDGRSKRCMQCPTCLALKICKNFSAYGGKVSDILGDFLA